MLKIRLELDHIAIEKSKERWNLYFILATENPEDPDQMVLSVFPSHPIKMRKEHDNKFIFEPRGDGDLNGLILLERDMPADRSVKARLWFMHNKDKARDAGAIINKVSSAISGNKVSDKVLKALGVANPWIAVAGTVNTIAGLVGKFMEKTKDRNLGFANLDEAFSDKDIQLKTLERIKDHGTAKLEWTWVVTE